MQMVGRAAGGGRGGLVISGATLVCYYGALLSTWSYPREDECGERGVFHIIGARCSVGSVRLVQPKAPKQQGWRRSGRPPQTPRLIIITSSRQPPTAGLR